MQASLTKTLLKIGLFGPLFLSAVGAAAAGCPPGEILVAEDATNWYCREAKAYKNSEGPKLADQYCATNKKVAADQNAIRNLGFAVDVERYRMFGKVAQDQQADLKRKIMLAMFDQGLLATGNILDGAKSLNPWNVNKAVKLLEEKGFGNEQLIASLRDVARVRGKPEIAAAYHRFEELAKSTVEGYSTGQGMAKEPETAQLQLLAGALKTMQGNYELGLVITGLEFGESIAYLSYVSGEMNSLAQETDDKLAKLVPLAARLKDHVKYLVSTREAWQTEMDIPVAPSCGR
jgi:hypothetical protein